jgi:hypothetical protein
MSKKIGPAPVSERGASSSVYAFSMRFEAIGTTIDIAVEKVMNLFRPSVRDKLKLTLEYEGHYKGVWCRNKKAQVPANSRGGRWYDELPKTYDVERERVIDHAGLVKVRHLMEAMVPATEPQPEMVIEEMQALPVAQYEELVAKAALWEKAVKAFGDEAALVKDIEEATDA